jgi:hypothetical protein
MASSHHAYRLPSIEETIGKLQSLLHFDPEDLALNRKGQLSASQRADILHNDVAGPIFWSMLTVLGAWALQTVKLLLEGHSVLDAVTSFFGMPTFLRATEAASNQSEVPMVSGCRWRRTRCCCWDCIGCPGSCSWIF